MVSLHRGIVLIRISPLHCHLSSRLTRCQNSSAVITTSPKTPTKSSCQTCIHNIEYPRPTRSRRQENQNYPTSCSRLPHWNSHSLESAFSVIHAPEPRLALLEAPTLRSLQSLRFRDFLHRQGSTPSAMSEPLHSSLANIVRTFEKS